jgi:hypothetical protein
MPQLPRTVPHLLVIAAAALLAACDRPSVVVERPADPRVNRALERVWVEDIHRVARSGDWILSRSYSVAGDVISVTPGEAVSHASIYDAERGTVIEAISPVVREVPLAQLLGRNRFVYVVRPYGQAPEDGRRAVARARAKLGADFDYAGVMGLDRPEAFYCSELVAWASGVPLGDQLVVTPSELFEMGELVYFSGARDDRATQRAAIARVATLH